MEVREYKEEDREMLNSWFCLRIKENLPLPVLPKVGYIVSDVAAGFLIGTDSTFCIFEPFISNPQAPRDQRAEALDKIIIQLLKKAKELNFTSVYGFSTSLPMIKRGMKHGFSVQEINSTTIFKEIK